MDKIIQKICSAVVKQYKQDKNVLGIMLFGSVARNKFDQYSDIDIYILLNKKGKFSRSNFVKGEVRVDIIFNTAKEVKNYLKEDTGSVRRITSHMLANGKILFQRDGLFKKVQLIAQKNLALKTICKSGEVLMHKYSIDDFWGEVQRDIKNKDYIALGLDSQLLINNILELFLKLNREFLQQPNEMAKTLKRLDKKFADRMENFYKENDIQKKENILAELVKYIYGKSGGPLPNRWVLKD